MLLSTTPKLEGKTITEYKGLVFGEAIIGANLFKDIFASIRDLVGGRTASYEKVIQEARMIAVTEMSERAEKLGANGIVGIDVDYEVVGQGGSMMMVSVSGTAVYFSS